MACPSSICFSNNQFILSVKPKLSEGNSKKLWKGELGRPSLSNLAALCASAEKEIPERQSSGLPTLMLSYLLSYELDEGDNK